MIPLFFCLSQVRKKGCPNQFWEQYPPRAVMLVKVTWKFQYGAKTFRQVTVLHRKWKALTDRPTKIAPKPVFSTFWRVYKLNRAWHVSSNSIYCGTSIRGLTTEAELFSSPRAQKQLLGDRLIGYSFYWLTSKQEESHWEATGRKIVLFTSDVSLNSGYPIICYGLISKRYFRTEPFI